MNEKYGVGHTYTVRFDLKYLYISFEEFVEEVKHKTFNKTHCLGIDMNPDTIGISVIENDRRIIHVQEFSLKQIFNEILSQKLSSSSQKMKHLQNKLKFETLEISKAISTLAQHFHCSMVFIEDLHFKGSTNANRKNKNLWKKGIFILNLIKRLKSLGIKLVCVNPVYSSFIGNMMYDYTDAVNASLEISRRGLECKLLKLKGKFYPNLLLVKHQWKETATKFEDWKEFYLETTKNLKLKYRVSLDDVKHHQRVFKQISSHKSKVLCYVFYD